MRKFLTGLLLLATSLALGGNNAQHVNTGGSLSTASKTIHTRAVAGGAPSITQTGTGFGTRASLTPLFAQTFSTTTNGQLATAVGYYQAGSPAATVDMTVGFISGQGSLKWSTGTGVDNGFMYNQFGHIAVAGFSEQQLYEQVYFKPVRTQGTGSYASMQMKALRETTTAEYDGYPKFTSSLYLPSDLSTLNGVNMAWRDQTNTEAGNYDESGTFSTVQSRFAAAMSAGRWILQERWVKYNDIGQSNGFASLNIQGAPIVVVGANTGLALRTSSGDLINYASLMPGLDNFVNGDQYTFYFAEHIIDNTPQRMVLCNASSWAACDQKVYLFLTAWSNTSVTAPMRKVPWATTGETGKVWSFVVNASNTADSGVARTAY